MKSIKLLLTLAIASLVQTGCISTYVPPDEPGLYGSPSRWNGGSDVDGKVGYKLYVSNPRAKCVPGDWNAYMSVVTGTLPPGLNMDEHGAISGIPTARGNWVVTMRLSNLTCNGSNYPDQGFTQQLIFHITGSGQVVQ